MPRQDRLWPKFLILVIWLEVLFAGATIYAHSRTLWSLADFVDLLKAAFIAAIIALFGAGLWRSRRYRVFYLFSFFAVGFSGAYLENAWIGIGAPVTALFVALLAHRSAEMPRASASR